MNPKLREKHTIKILGLSFFKGNAQEVVYFLKSGGLLMVPAAPALVNITNDVSYYHSLQTADIIIPDSAYMTLIWNLAYKEKLQKISGLKLLRTFLEDREVIETVDILLVDPSRADARYNVNYLRSNGFLVNDDISYVAPLYNKGAIEDKVLLDLIEEKRPRFIIINLGGGVQEKLGAYLKRKLSYIPAIICTGAAIAFLTGRQVRIPTWGDRYYLGWLFRCIDKPSLYVPRYLKGFKLLSMLLNHGPNAPFVKKSTD